MPIIAYALFGFVGGFFAMAMIRLYKWAFKKWVEGFG